MRNLVILVALFLATGQLAATDRAGGKNILRSGRAFHPALFLSLQAAEGAQTGPQWKSREEYDAFQVFTQEQDLNKKIGLIDAFLEKFKDTDFKESILLLKMQAYQGLNDGAGAAKTAREVLAINPNQVDALYLLSFTFPYTFQPGDADAESGLSRALSDARTGLSALEQMPKPPNMSDSQFAEYVKPRRLVFNNTVGFAALQQKDYPMAITYLKVVSGETPNDALVFYRLGLAYLYSDPPDHDNTVWYLARAVSLAGAGNNSLNEDEIRRFLTRAYVSRYRSEAGLSDIITQAAASPTPPEGFAVPTPPETSPTATPSEKVFLTLAHPLRGGGETAQKSWDQAKGTRLPMAGKVDSLVKGDGAGKYNVRIDLISDSQSAEDGVYDVVLKVSGQAKASNLAKGDIIRFEGDLDGYQVTPNFFFTLANARINPEDLPAFAPGKGPKPPQTRRDRIRQE